MLVLLAGHAGAELVPATPFPKGAPLRMTFEILPADPARPLPESLHTFEGGRLTLEEAWARGERYRRATFVFPLPSGDTRERVVFFAEDGGRLRMIGFHRILRHYGMPEGETIVFNPAPELPLQGRGVEVPADTYTLLGLFTALGGVAAAGTEMSVHVWLDGPGPVAVGIRPDGNESLEVLGSKLESRRLRLSPRQGQGPEATYWIAADEPHHFLQYHGPADFLSAGGDAPRVVIRATSSSEQVKRAFEDLAPDPD